MPNLAIYLGYDRPAGTRQLAGTLPPLPIPGFIAGGCDRIPSKYGIPAISCLSVLLCRTGRLSTKHSDSRFDGDAADTGATHLSAHRGAEDLWQLERRRHP